MESTLKNPIVSKRRDATRLIFEILRLSADGASKTKIRYRLGLNFKLTERYVAFLQGKRLIQLGPDGNGAITYELTRPGMRLLHFLAEVEKELAELFPRSLASETSAGGLFWPTGPLDGRKPVRELIETQVSP